MSVYLILFLVVFLFLIIGHVINLSKEADEDVLKSKSIEDGRNKLKGEKISSTNTLNRQKIAPAQNDFICDENLGSFSGHSVASGHIDGGSSSVASSSSVTSCYGGE